MKVGLREANQRFSRTMQAVRRGEEVVLTERGRPSPLSSRSPAGADAGLVGAAPEPGHARARGGGPVAVTGNRPSRIALDGWPFVGAEKCSLSCQPLT